MIRTRLIGVALAFVTSIFSLQVSAANYTITFFELIGDLTDGNNLYDDYQVSGTGTFEINDAAIGPDSLVLFSDSSNFLAFHADLTTTLGNGQFTLGLDDFPPADNMPLNTDEQGILFDASGQPLRFDNPDTSSSNTAAICDPGCDQSVLNLAQLTLWDDDNFDRVFLDDGTITTSIVAITNGFAFTPFNGNWDLKQLGSVIITDHLKSFYLIETAAVPLPAAVWLFGSGLIGLIGISRHKKAS